MTDFLRDELHPWILKCFRKHGVAGKHEVNHDKRHTTMIRAPTSPFCSNDALYAHSQTPRTRQYNRSVRQGPVREQPQTIDYDTPPPRLHVVKVSRVH